MAFLASFDFYNTPLLQHHTHLKMAVGYLHHALIDNLWEDNRR